MSFTYTGNPLTNTVDAIRVEIADTLVNQHELEDEEILYAYAKEGTVVRAAARCCEMLAAKYSKREIFRGATAQSEKTNVSLKYQTQARLLRARGITAGSFVMPANSISEKNDNETNTDSPQPSFKRGLHDNPDVEGESGADIDLTVTGNT